MNGSRESDLYMETGSRKDVLYISNVRTNQSCKEKRRQEFRDNKETDP